MPHCLLLLCVPLLDVVLIVASLADVASGSPPGPVHGLAAVYLGFTVAFGHSMVRWADARFAHRFAGGPPPPPVPRHGPAKVRYEWRAWGQALFAWVLALGVLQVFATVADTGVPDPLTWSADPMWSWAARTGVVVAVWFVGWPLWTTLFPPHAPARARSER